MNNDLKKIIDELNPSTAKIFLVSFLKLYYQNGFQSLSKKDIDLLLFSLSEKYGVISGETNYEKAKLLKITPNKLKSLQIESYMRWSDEEAKFILRKLFQRVFSAGNIQNLKKVQVDELEKNRIPIIVENPVEKLEIERMAKEKYSIVKKYLNEEIISLDLNTFFEIAFCTLEDGEKNRLKKIFEDLDIDDIKSLLTKKDFTKIKFDEYRKILNEIGFEAIKVSGTSLLQNLTKVFI